MDRSSFSPAPFSAAWNRSVPLVENSSSLLQTECELEAGASSEASPVPPTNACVPRPAAGRWRPEPSCVYRGTLYCVAGGLRASLSEQHVSTLLNIVTGQATPVGANASISRNGRYLASYSSGNVFNPLFVLTDQAGGTTLFQGTFAPQTVSIAADGTTALTMGSSLQLIKGGVLSTLVSSNVTAAGIDDGAATILYETQSPRRLFVLNLNTMETKELGPANRDSFQGTLSADGQWVAYLSTIGSTPQKSSSAGVSNGAPMETTGALRGVGAVARSAFRRRQYRIRNLPAIIRSPPTSCRHRERLRTSGLTH